MKYHRHKKVRRLFANKPVYAYPPVKAEWLKTISEEAKLARYRHHLSQAALAKLAQTSQSEISQLETGKSNPTVEFIERVARKLGLVITVSIE